MNYVIGAYVASPTLDRWDATAERQYYDGLRRIPQIGAIEHPFYGSMHRDDDDWFRANVNRAWDYVLTCIPGTVDRMKADPNHGLASTDHKGRLEAVAFHKLAANAVAQLNDLAGRRAVIAVQIHSAPRQRKAGDGSSAAFRDSLEELALLDLQGATLVVEHCDAFTGTHQADKGFLSLGEEIDALRSLKSRVGVTVNWARSAIEERSAEGPLRHIALLREARLLEGLIFSGVSATDGPYGVWKDSHAPPASWRHGSILPTQSLMTRQEIARCLRAAGTLNYVGAKVRPLPKSATLDERLGVIRETIETLNAAAGDPAIG